MHVERLVLHDVIRREREAIGSVLERPDVAVAGVVLELFGDRQPDTHLPDPSFDAGVHRPAGVGDPPQPDEESAEATEHQEAHKSSAPHVAIMATSVTAAARTSSLNDRRVRMLIVLRRDAQADRP